MADPPLYPDSDSETGDDTGIGLNHGSAPSTPRWVKVFGIILIVLVLLVVIMMLAGGGKHGPGRHTSSGVTGGHSAPERGHR